MRKRAFKTVCLLLSGNILLPKPAQALEPQADFLLRITRADKSGFEQRDFPRNGSAGKDDLEGSGRMFLGTLVEPLDQVQLHLSALAAARWGSEDAAMFEAGESFLKLENIAMTPITVAAGRQTVSWGRGLLFSDENRDHLFDMASVCWDTLPHRLEVFYAYPALSVFDSPVNHLWLARWFYQADGRSSAEIFGGAMSLKDDGSAALAGMRGVCAPGPAWETWVELAGEAGERNSEKDLSAAIADIGAVRKFSKGSVRASWTWASGRANDEHAFVPLFNGEHWGRLYDPLLSSLHIITVSATRALTEKLHITAEYFDYWEAAGGNRLGGEADLTASCEVSETLTLELGGCVFFTDDALRAMEDHTQSEIRFQISANF